MIATPAAAAVIDRRGEELHEAGDFDTAVAYHAVNVPEAMLGDPTVFGLAVGRAAEGALRTFPGLGRAVDPASIRLEVAVQEDPPKWGPPGAEITVPITTVVATVLVRPVAS